MDNCYSKSASEPEIHFISLGMLVLDEIRFPSKTPITNVMGGSGCYATLGSRLFSGPIHSQQIGCIVVAGKDFPAAAAELLRGWNMSLDLRSYPDKLSTRGLLEYQDDTFGPKKFRYTTPPLKPAPLDLLNANLIRAKSFHFLASPEDVSVHTKQIMELRGQHGISERPLFVWEPIPAACSIENRQEFLRACQYVDVFSPNHLEMASFFEHNPGKDFNEDRAVSYAKTFLEALPRQTGNECIVLRAGEYGCLTASHTVPFFWTSPYYGRGASEVVDPTGAGNAFLGGFTHGLQITKDVPEATRRGTVAASFALEQIGLPSRVASEATEQWNGSDVWGRLKALQERTT